MLCPYCKNEESKVIDSRQSEGGMAIRRRRECEVCQKRFTTYERYEDIHLVVVKKDGRREPFSRAKLLGGLLRACEKRPVPTETLNELALAVEREIWNSDAAEVDSAVIGEKVMEKLFSLDEVAYIRFASVYRQFKDIDRFMQELNRLVSNREQV
ncbi:MAG: transcriptional regulator NrdR [Gracilibacteraceae bacterium]|nr:transcriptional regulator NrdR [Gracilibacteraceae bacterium]